MKKVLLISLLISSVLMLSSCLDGTDSHENHMVYFGFVEIDMKAGGNVIYFNDKDYPLYSPTLSQKISDGECCLVQFSIKSEDNPSVATTGYYKIQETGYYLVNKGIVMPIKTDTAILKENELAMADLAFNNYVKGYLFINSYHEAMLTDQKNQYELSYNMEQEPVLENTKNVYQLYLRANKSEDGKSPNSNQIIPNAYEVKRFFDNISYKEKNKGNSEFYFKVHYIKSFKDDTIPQWKTTEIQIVNIPKDE
ncbi:MAG: hypothetical protein LBH58_03640 [Tannerellaceae bacterium]|jgi:hypothetical protein|nr:hypothetical protein [Tannerellaceae bacterium]